VDVVVAVSVAVCAVVPLMETDVGERLHVGVLTGFETLVVTAQVSVTVPSNEFEGVTVISDVLPLVAPAVTAMLPPLERLKLVLPAGASQKPLHPERHPTARQLIPRTQTPEKPNRSGAAKLRNRASSPKTIAAPLVMRPFHSDSRVTLSSGPCLFIASARTGSRGLKSTDARQRVSLMHWSAVHDLHVPA
jgi:hypothetical protein